MRLMAFIFVFIISTLSFSIIGTAQSNCRHNKKRIYTERVPNPQTIWKEYDATTHDKYNRTWYICEDCWDIWSEDHYAHYSAEHHYTRENPNSHVCKCICGRTISRCNYKDVIEKTAVRINTAQHVAYYKKMRKCFCGSVEPGSVFQWSQTESHVLEHHFCTVCYTIN